MKSNAFTALLMLVFLCAACLVVGPVLSGEHPWDSDRDDDGPNNGGDTFYTGDTVTPVLDTVPDEEATTPPETTVTTWFAFFAGAFTAATLSL